MDASEAKIRNLWFIDLFTESIDYKIGFQRLRYVTCVAHIIISTQI